MKVLLKDIATIQTGLFTRPGNTGDIIYLQVKDFNAEGELTGMLQPELESKSNFEKHLLQNNDILFAAKGNKNFATVYKKETGAAAAASSFFVIRIFINHDIIPEYLAWIINQPQTMKILKDNAMGTSIQSISKQVLGNIEIAIPPTETQMTILKIHELRKREIALIAEIESEKNNYIKHLLIKATTTNGR